MVSLIALLWFEDFFRNTWTYPFAWPVSKVSDLYGYVSSASSHLMHGIAFYGPPN